MKVHFTDQAADDLETIKAHLVVRSPVAARNVQRAFTQLADFPFLGREQTTIGKSKGESCEVTTPKGPRSFEILKVEWK